MRRQLTIGLVLLLVCGVLASSLQADDKGKDKKDKKKAETYAATAMAVAGTAAGRTLSLTIRIEDYTSDEEAAHLAEILKTEGADKLRRALEKLDKGRISVVGRTGNTAAVIRSRPMEKGRRIIIVTDRPISFIELHQSTRSRDYQFGVIELLLDENGRGEGTALAAAKIKFTGENTIEVEHYGIEPVRLANVRAF